MRSPTKSTLGSDLAMYMKRQKPPMSQTALARRLGVTQSAVSDWVRDRAKPTVTRAYEIEVVLGAATGALVRYITELPEGVTFRPPGVAEAINADQRLTLAHKDLLHDIYSVLVKIDRHRVRERDSPRKNK